MNLRIFLIEWADFIELPITWEISELSWKEVGLKIVWLSRASTAMPLFLKSIEERHTIGEWEPKNYSEALSRLKWKAFIDWIEENNVNVDDVDEEQVKNAVTAVQNLMWTRKMSFAWL